MARSCGLFSQRFPSSLHNCQLNRQRRFQLLLKPIPTNHQRREGSQGGDPSIVSAVRPGQGRGPDSRKNLRGGCLYFPPVAGPKERRPPPGCFLLKRCQSAMIRIKETAVLIDLVTLQIHFRVPRISFKAFDFAKETALDKAKAPPNSRRNAAGKFSDGGVLRSQMGRVECCTDSLMTGLRFPTTFFLPVAFSYPPKP